MIKSSKEMTWHTSIIYNISDRFREDKFAMFDDSFGPNESSWNFFWWSRSLSQQSLNVFLHKSEKTNRHYNMVVYGWKSGLDKKKTGMVRTSNWRGEVLGEYLWETLPSGETKNLVKFHLIASMSKPPFSAFKYLYNGAVFFPFTSTYIAVNSTINIYIQLFCLAISSITQTHIS